MDILYDYPIILTKDKDALQRLGRTVFEPGALVLLPQDAVLIIKPEIKVTEIDYSVKDDEIIFEVPKPKRKYTKRKKVAKK